MDYGTDHLARFVALLGKTHFKRPNGAVGIDAWTEAVVEKLQAIQARRGTVFFVGNGASQGMASHFSTDMTKNGWLKGRALTDPSLLTCFSNDYSYEEAYAEILKRWFEPGDGLVAISSSGRSPNIVAAARLAREREPGLLLGLTGFSNDNPVFGLSDHGVYVPAADYGMVESAHAYFFHLIIDYFCKQRAQGAL